MILEYMLQRLYSSLQKDPSLNARPHNSRQRVDGVFSSLGSPAFACTPDKFPDLMAGAIQNTDIEQWAANNNIVIERGQWPGRQSLDR